MLKHRVTDSESFVDASISGGELQVAFNSRYLADVLGVLKHGTVTLGRLLDDLALGEFGKCFHAAP